MLNELHEATKNYTDISYFPSLVDIIPEDQYQNMKSNNGCNYYFYLHNLVKILKPKHVVELGTSIGRSAHFMMTALQPDSILTTIEMGSFLRVDLKPFEYDKRLNIVYGSDIDPAVYAPLNLKDIDFLFIDTLHDKAHVEIEWSIYKEFLAPGALVVMDDINLNEGMIEFWNNLPYEKVNTGSDIHFSGFGIFKV